MKKMIVLILALTMVAGGVFAKVGEDSDDGGYKLAWYASAVHPYFDAVQKGVIAFEADTGIEVHQQIGPDWTQDSKTQNLEALAAKGYTGF